MKLKISKPVKTALKIILSVSALIFVFSKIHYGEVIDLIKQSDPYFMMLAIACFAFSKFIAAMRLRSFLQAIDIPISQDNNLRLYLLGMFYNLFLPGGIGGDGYKLYLLNKKFNVKVRTIFWAIFFDRLNGVLLLFILACVLSFFLSFTDNYKPFIGLLIPISLLLYYLVVHVFFPYFKAISTKVTLQSLIVQLLQIATAWAILKGIGINNLETGYLFIFLISSIVSMLPFTIGGIGSREIAFLYGAQWMSLDINASVAIGLMFYLVIAFVSFFGIYYSIYSRKVYIEPGLKAT